MTGVWERLKAIGLGALYVGFTAIGVILLIAGCVLGPASSPTPDPAYRTKAQLLADKLITGLGRDHVKAAAYAITTVDGYVATLPDTAGFDPPPGDHVVLMVEIAGWWSPAPHRCPLGVRCDGTAVVLAYDFTGTRTWTANGSTTRGHRIGTRPNRA